VDHRKPVAAAEMLEIEMNIQKKTKNAIFDAIKQA
jgi:hypothetical protein